MNAKFRSEFMQKDMFGDLFKKEEPKEPEDKELEEDIGVTE